MKSKYLPIIGFKIISLLVSMLILVSCIILYKIIQTKLGLEVVNLGDQANLLFASILVSLLIAYATERKLKSNYCKKHLCTIIKSQKERKAYSELVLGFILYSVFIGAISFMMPMHLLFIFGAFLLITLIYEFFTDTVRIEQE